jgi:hypothetical protein
LIAASELIIAAGLPGGPVAVAMADRQRIG